MNGTQQAEQALAHEAAEWLDRLQENSSETRAAFAKWLTTSPLHVKMFLELSSVDRLLDALDREQMIDVDEMLRGESTGVVVLQRDAPATHAAAPNTRNLRRTRWTAWAAAWVALAIAAGWWASIELRQARTYATEPGELRTMRLPDGSAIDLGAGSRVELRFSDARREVFLEGEALFDVHKDATRPFLVHSGDVVIQAIGTQFRVHRRPSGTVVSVIEGVVQVSPQPGLRPADRPRLRAGEEAVVRNQGQVERRPRKETASAGMRRSRLIFEDERLEDIAAEFNRWNPRQLHIEGEKLAARVYSGAFEADDPESLIAFLVADGTLETERNGDGVVIRARQSSQ